MMRLLVTIIILYVAMYMFTHMSIDLTGIIGHAVNAMMAR